MKAQYTQSTKKERQKTVIFVNCIVLNNYPNITVVMTSLDDFLRTVFSFMHSSYRYFPHPSYVLVRLCLTLWTLSVLSLPSYGKDSRQNFSSKTQIVKKVTKPAKKRKATQSSRPIPLPIPSRADALSDNATQHEYSLEIFSDMGSERGVVRLTLRETQNVEIEAFNILGKRVAEIYTGEVKAGMNTVGIDLSSLSNGVYICVVRGRHFKTAQKFIVSR